MNTLQQAYISGFVKRASQHGIGEYQAIELLKHSEELKGDQHKLDIDHDGKIEAEDLRKLRATKKKEKSAEFLSPVGHALGNFVSNRPKLHNFLENYSNNYNTAIGHLNKTIPEETPSPLAPSLINPLINTGLMFTKRILAPIASHGAAAYETLGKK